MREWLKFFFAGFFRDKYNNAAERSFFNAVLAVVLAYIFLALGFFVGLVAPFAHHYDSSTQFSEFVTQATAGVNLQMKDGKLSADVSRNDFAGVKEGELDGYGVIIETGPAATTFDDFSVVCVDKSGKEISYADYSLLSENEKATYTPQLLFGGKKLDVTVKQDEYKSVLNQSQSGKVALAELDDKLATGQISEKEYNDGVYVAYVKAYYPPMSGVEKYGGAPTLRTYCLGMTVSSFSDRFLILLDDMCIGAFITDSGVKVDFEGYYKGIPDGKITDIRAFILDAFDGGKGYIFALNLLNMFKVLPVLFVAMLVLALIMFVVYRVKAGELRVGYVDSLKLCGSYLLYSALFASLVCMIASVFLSKSTVYIVSLVACLAVLACRSLVRVLVDIMNFRREQNSSDGADNNL